MKKLLIQLFFFLKHNCCMQENILYSVAILLGQYYNSDAKNVWNANEFAVKAMTVE